MTLQEVINYYADLLIVQYKDQPRAYATVQACALLAIMDMLPLDVQASFNLDTAVGVQLDTLAKYHNVSRYSYGPNGEFTLNDTDFISLIKMAIVKNSSDSSLSKIQELLNSSFPTSIQIIDTLNMKIHYIFDVVSDNLLYAFINEIILPRPMGVGTTCLLSVDDISKILGFRTYSGPNNRSSSFGGYPLIVAGYATDKVSGMARALNNNAQRWAMPFVLSTNTVLTEATFGLTPATGTPVGSVFAQLCADDSGAPGAVLASSSSVDVTTITYPPLDISFTFTSGYSMSAGTDYWLVLVGDSTYYAGISGTTNTIGVVDAIGTPLTNHAKYYNGIWNVYAQSEGFAINPPADLGHTGISFISYADNIQE